MNRFIWTNKRSLKFFKCMLKYMVRSWIVKGSWRSFNTVERKWTRAHLAFCTGSWYSERKLRGSCTTTHQKNMKKKTGRQRTYIAGIVMKIQFSCNLQLFHEHRVYNPYILVKSSNTYFLKSDTNVLGYMSLQSGKKEINILSYLGQDHTNC